MNVNPLTLAETAIRFIEATVHPSGRLDAAGLLKLDRASERMTRLTSHLARLRLSTRGGELRP